MTLTTRQFIDKRLGGTEQVAARVRRKPSAIRMWAHRGAVPRSVWPDLLDAYPELTMDELRSFETQAARKSRRPS